MITRIWHGRTTTADAAKYRSYVMESGIRDYRSVRGNLGAQIWQREEGSITHIWTVTWWDSFDSIKAFAGEDFGKAKYYPEDEKYLLEFEENVIHCSCYDFGGYENGN